MRGTCDECGKECEVFPCETCDLGDPYEDCTCCEPDLCDDCWRKSVSLPLR